MDTLVKKLDQMQTNDERCEHLSIWCPCLYIFVLQKRGMVEKLSAYVERCKLYENDKDPSTFSLYVHGYWLPYLQRLEEQRLLVKGKARIGSI